MKDVKCSKVLGMQESHLSYTRYQLNHPTSFFSFFSSFVCLLSTIHSNDPPMVKKKGPLPSILQSVNVNVSK